MLGLSEMLDIVLDSNLPETRSVGERHGHRAITAVKQNGTLKGAIF